MVQTYLKHYLSNIKQTQNQNPMYLIGNGSSKSIKIFNQLPHSNLIPWIPILLSKYKIRRKLITNASPAL